MRRQKGFRYSLTKHPYYKVIYPNKVDTGESIRGWWIRDEPDGICTCPNPCEMNSCGWIQTFLCVLFFWPCAPVPCCLSGNYDGYQIPDFEQPIRRHIIYHTSEKNQQSSIPVATPIKN